MIEKFRIRLSQVFAVLLVIVTLLSSSRWENEIPLMSSVLFLIGIICVGIASLGRLWCSLYIAGYKSHVLIQSGPYSMCRNPLYFFSLIGAAGIGLATETFSITAMIVIAFALYYPLVIRSEEDKLRRLHPGDLDAYIRKVPSFFPKLALLAEPSEYTVKPKIFKRHMFDALWFVWIVGILEIIEELHELEVLPVLFTLY